MIYSPQHVAPRRIDTVTAQIDIAATVLGLLGLPYQAPFFGEDVVSHPEVPHVALLSHNQDVALFRDDEMVVLGLDRTSTTYRYDAAADRYIPIAGDPGLENLAIAYYQVAFDLFRQHRFL